MHAATTGEKYRTGDTDWLANCRYGISFHWTGQSEPRQGPILPFQEAVEHFHLEAFLEAIQESGADYVIFTSTHAKQELPCPHEMVDSILKGRTCERDLLGEIADGLAKMGKHLIIYYNHSCNQGQDRTWENAVGYHAPDKERLAENLMGIVSAMGLRYGKKVKGWWFDSSYSLDPRGPYNTVSTDMANFQFPWEAFTQAAKAGFPERLVTYNSGIMLDFLYTTHQDYWAGEMLNLANPPSGRYARNGLLWHGWTCLDDRNWVWTDRKCPEPPSLYSDGEIAEFLKKCRISQVPMCFNVAISQEGIVSATAVKTLRRIQSGLLQKYGSLWMPRTHLMSLKLSSLFSDHMVLQRAEKVPFWGRAEPDDEITISLAGKNEQSRVDASGHWVIELDLSTVGPGPFDLTIAGTKSGRVIITDVLIGEVWLASGQSNMEWPLEKSLEAREEIPRSGNIRIREFRVEQASCAKASKGVTGKWSVAGPETTPAFSAVGYYFARMAEKTLQGPVGIIHSSWGGSRLESWISPEVLNEEETSRANNEWRQINAAGALRQRYVEQYRFWEKQYGRKDPGSPAPEKFISLNIDQTGWKPVSLPGKLADFGLPDAGVTWLRKKVTIPSEYARPGMFFHVGPMRDFERLYINGELVRETTCESPHQLLNSQRWFHIATRLPEGEATLAIRLFSPAGGAEISGGSFRIEGGIPIDGEWLAKNESEFPPLAPEAVAAMPQPPSPLPPLQNIPGGLFNAMIAPLVPYALAGVLWYQGESNIREANLYPDGFRRMVEYWRRAWRRPSLPFYYCQLPDKGEKFNEPDRNAFAIAPFREAQAKSLELPQAHMAVLMGLGEALDIHPRNKKDVGERLARLVLTRTYGRDLHGDAPQFDSMKIEGAKVRLRFRHASNGLIAQALPDEYILRHTPDFIPQMAPLLLPSPGSELQGFIICGADRQWKWAQARIEDGDSVLVWSEGVDLPLAVRYAWADSPTCNLFSKAGIPAMPFRTDDFPIEKN